jgi:acyl dehydratase
MNYSVGSALPPFVVDEVSPQAMQQWAGFLADPNPIHLDPAAVKAKGLGDRVINQGPANVAYMMNMLMRAFPAGRIVSMDSRFLGNVCGGDRAVVNGKVTAIDGNRFSCELMLEIEGRGAVNSATAIVEV